MSNQFEGPNGYISRVQTSGSLYDANLILFLIHRLFSLVPEAVIAPFDRRHFALLPLRVDRFADFFRTHLAT
jgi:hypothetical protein